MFQNSEKPHGHGALSPLNTTFKTDAPSQSKEALLPQVRKLANGSTLLIVRAASNQFEGMIHFDSRTAKVPEGGIHFIEHLIAARWESLVKQIFPQGRMIPLQATTRAYDVALSVQIGSALPPSAACSLLTKLTESVLEPDFRKETVEAQRGRIENEEGNCRNAGRIAEEALAKIRRAPASSLGHPEFIKKVSIKELQNVHSTLLNPSRMCGGLLIPSDWNETDVEIVVKCFTSLLEEIKRPQSTPAPTKPLYPSLTIDLANRCRGFTLLRELPDAYQNYKYPPAKNVTVAWHLNEGLLSNRKSEIGLMGYAIALKDLINAELTAFLAKNDAVRSLLYNTPQFEIQVFPSATGIMVGIGFAPTPKHGAEIATWLSAFVEHLTTLDENALNETLQKYPSTQGYQYPKLANAAVEAHKIKDLDQKAELLARCQCLPEGILYQAQQVRGVDIFNLLQGLSRETAVTVTEPFLWELAR